MKAPRSYREQQSSPFSSQVWDIYPLENKEVKVQSNESKQRIKETFWSAHRMSEWELHLSVRPEGETRDPEIPVEIKRILFGDFKTKSKWINVIRLTK